MSNTAGTYRRISSPLTPEMLEPLPEDCPGITVGQPLGNDEYRQLAALLERHPDKKLYALQLDSTRQEHITSIEFLGFFPRLRRFSCNLAFLRSLRGVEHLGRAESLSFFKAQLKPLPAKPAGLR